MDDEPTVNFRPRAGKIKHRSPLLRIDRDPQLDRTAVVHVVNRVQILPGKPLADFPQQILHAQLGVLLDAPHVELDHVLPVFLDQRADEADALLVGSNLRLEVVDVVGQTPRAAAFGVPRWFVVQQLCGPFFIELAFRDQFLGLDGGAFLVQFSRVWRHAAGENTSNVRCVESAYTL